ncbi:metalloregulator ArsR/SmtB family transcription factor [Longispora sp. NPDC051575]|uniref:ArsR/SmtB family transcription factor n=1 Tax=Longispora sp. NPDC051575 TaxID=3154943 RepID=UPI003422AC01
MPLNAVELSQVRFARSPLYELVASLATLMAEPHRRHLHQPWVTATRPRVAHLDLSVPVALVTQPCGLPDFVAPPPRRWDGDIADELHRLRATPAADVRASLAGLEDAGRLPPQLRPLFQDPDRELGTLVDTLRAYWRAAVEPVWPRLRAVLDEDRNHRSMAFAAGGLHQVFAHLHPQVDYHDDSLWLTFGNRTRQHHLRGNGLLLVPCVFAWPRLGLVTYPDYQPTLVYPPRGIGAVWEAASMPDTDHTPLSALLGRHRATILAHLDLPVSTTRLAANLGLTPPAVSQHLAVLRRAGLVRSRRAGREVLYERTPTAGQLLDAANEAPRRAGTP